MKTVCTVFQQLKQQKVKYRALFLFFLELVSVAQINYKEVTETLIN